LILWLRDLEFFPSEMIQARANKEEAEMKIPIYYWGLLCIESYLLDRLLRGKDEEHPPYPILPFFE